MSDLAIAHLLTADAPTLRLERLVRLLAAPDAPPQHVLHLGAGPVPLALPAHPRRVHTPLPLGVLRAAALRRALARLGALSARTTILHAWSHSAVTWARPLAGGHRPILLEVDPEADLSRAAAWSAAGPLHCLCDSDATAARLHRHGTPPGHVRVIRPTPRPIPRARRSLVREQLRLEPSDRAVLALPPVTRRAGTLIAAWATMLLEKVRRDLRLVLPAAGGREAERVRYLITSSRHPHMTRWAPTTLSLPELLSAADVALTLPTADIDTTAVVQAAAAGCPIVAAPVPALREVLAGRAGIHATSANPEAAARGLLHVLESPASDSGTGLRADELAADNERLRSEYRDVYGRLASRRPIRESAIP